MFKVIAPMDKKDGSKWWMRCGSAFLNKDNSINVYLDALPLGQQQITLQLRELTEEELRERSDRRASYSSRGSHGNTGGAGGVYNDPVSLPTMSSESTVSDVPF
ncbi:MAG: hypothetical protein HOV81_40880 [Kofleriaceae bacterium]|nr:hypothetical protein [Kofleriaceae bacterium]